MVRGRSGDGQGMVRGRLGAGFMERDIPAFAGAGLVCESEFIVN